MTEEIEDIWCSPTNPRQVTYADVSAAAIKIRSILPITPCNKSQMFERTGMQLYLKKEIYQYTGSFKERGALYALLMLDQEQKKRGVIAASSGNHAQAIAYHGRNLSIPVTVVMPVTAPILKIMRCRHFKAKVVVVGQNIAESRIHALKRAQAEDLMYINGYDHPHVLAGQGSCALEILEQVPDVDAILLGVGGGGLLAGTVQAIKGIKPSCKVYAVESDRCPAFTNALSHGKPTFTPCESTLADGLAVPLVGYNSFATAAPLVDRVIIVRERWIPLAMLRLVEMEKIIVEGAGAVSIAAILAGLVNELKDKKVVVILTGGNIDSTVLTKCLDRGLQIDGRLQKFRVSVCDKSEGILELTSVLSKLGVQIKDISQDRASADADVFHVQIKVIVETTDKHHADSVRRAVKKIYSSAKFYDFPLPVALEQD